jgi:hypothetical protein
MGFALSRSIRWLPGDRRGRRQELLPAGLKRPCHDRAQEDHGRHHIPLPWLEQAVHCGGGDLSHLKTSIAATAQKLTRAASTPQFSQRGRRSETRWNPTRECRPNTSGLDALGTAALNSNGNDMTGAPELLGLPANLSQDFELCQKLSITGFVN